MDRIHGEIVAEQLRFEEGEVEHIHGETEGVAAEEGELERNHGAGQRRFEEGESELIPGGIGKIVAAEESRIQSEIGGIVAGQRRFDFEEGDVERIHG